MKPGDFEIVGVAADVVKEDRSDWPVDQRLSQRIIDGDRERLRAAGSRRSLARRAPRRAL